MSGCSECYGNFLNVDTTGTLEPTVKTEGLSCVGFHASGEDCRKKFEEHGEIPCQHHKSWQWWDNAEANNVQNCNKMDTGRTHNYANNVDARANFYKRTGYCDL